MVQGNNGTHIYLCPLIDMFYFNIVWKVELLDTTLNELAERSKKCLLEFCVLNNHHDMP